MKFIKYLRFDIYQGILRNSMLIISPILIAAVIFVDFFLKADRYVTFDILDEPVSFGDYLFYLYGGMKEFIPDHEMGFQLPIVWIIVFFVLPFILLGYPLKDMNGSGQQILIRSTKRTFWWLSKCCWNILGTLFYHFIMLMTGLVACLVFRIDTTSNIHMDFVKAAFEVGPREIREISVLFISTVILPVCVSASINMLQMTLAIFIKPIFSFLVISILLLTSAYLMSPLLIGNYAMIFRYTWILENGVSVEIGYSISLIILFISIITGTVRFHFYDILESGQEGENQ